MNTHPYSIIKAIPGEDWSVLHEDVLGEPVDWNRIGELSARLEATIRRDNLLGLSAVQVGLRIPAFLMDVTYKGKRYRSMCIQPRILGKYGRVVRHRETSASMPGIVIPVERNTVVKVSFQGQQMQEYVKVLEGMPAYVFQHLYDHLSGIMPEEKR